MCTCLFEAIPHSTNVCTTYKCLYSVIHTALLSLVVSKDRDPLQIPAKSEEVELIERILNLSTPVPTVEVTNNVASGGDTPAVAVAILPTLQTLLPSNLSG